MVVEEGYVSHANPIDYWQNQGLNCKSKPPIQSKAPNPPIQIQPLGPLKSKGCPELLATFGSGSDPERKGSHSLVAGSSCERMRQVRGQVSAGQRSSFPPPPTTPRTKRKKKSSGDCASSQDIPRHPMPTCYWKSLVNTLVTKKSGSEGGLKPMRREKSFDLILGTSQIFPGSSHLFGPR